MFKKQKKFFNAIQQLLRYSWGSKNIL